MKVTIGQINTTNGDIDGNIAKIVAAIEKARSVGSDLIVFPELTTHGYTSQDWFQDADIISHALEPLERIIPETTGITAIVGTIRPNERQRRTAAIQLCGRDPRREVARICRQDSAA